MRTIDHFSNVDNNIHIVLDSTTSNPLKDVIVDVDGDGVTIVSSNISNNHELSGAGSVLSSDLCPSYSILREDDDVSGVTCRLLHVGQVSPNILCQHLRLQCWILISIPRYDCIALLYLGSSLELITINRVILHHGSGVII